MKCSVCGIDYASKDHFETESICKMCYERQHPGKAKSEDKTSDINIGSQKEQKDHQIRNSFKSYFLEGMTYLFQVSAKVFPPVPCDKN